LKINIGEYVDSGDEKRKINIKIHDYDIYSLDHTLALIIHPCLVKFRSNLHGYPGDFHEEYGDGGGMKKWERILDKMILAFKLISEDEVHYDVKTQKKIKIGLKLFGKYYQNLWD